MPASSFPTPIFPVQTRLLILSDTLGYAPMTAAEAKAAESAVINGLDARALRNPSRFPDVQNLPIGYREPLPEADVVIHCGDMSCDGKIEDYRRTFEVLQKTKAPLTLVIAGHRDRPLDPASRKQYERENPQMLLEVDAMIEQAKALKIFFLAEGTHEFRLTNGARLVVYANPYSYTYRTQTRAHRDWGAFQHDGQHAHSNPSSVDIVMTHCPPYGVLDNINRSQRLGCHALFHAIAAARPRIHCFGHVPQGWGALLAKWHPREHTSQTEPHCTDFGSFLKETLNQLALMRTPYDELPRYHGKRKRRICEMRDEQYVYIDVTKPRRFVPKEHTLFVNASISDSKNKPHQRPFVIDILLDPAPALPGCESQLSASSDPEQSGEEEVGTEVGH
ncbi:hypothetical protein HIM_04713 [Hirsutella minnesotensis 3608]|uniref:Calcineurin-like phosphoesterase domain-containing protein n=1 Tax=Hirsutella minnesotensis 3608 TaxID=1043627 RepID=A0A0F8A5T5_9HYPO|nr:hypothetical protein HIM_04713 [Hirsutella minnesotensis 3608]